MGAGGQKTALSLGSEAGISTLVKKEGTAEPALDGRSELKQQLQQKRLNQAGSDQTSTRRSPDGGSQAKPVAMKQDQQERPVLKQNGTRVVERGEERSRLGSYSEDDE